MNDDLERRILYALATPLARLAARAGLSLNEVREVVDVAYYREARRRDLKMREIRELMDVSMSTATRLSRRLKSFFAQPEDEHGVHRRILALLWAEPLSATKVASAMADVDVDTVNRALSEMLADGRVDVEPGRTQRYALSTGVYRFTDHQPLARFQALNSFATSVAHAVEARFFDDQEHAFVRTNRLRMRVCDLPLAREFYESSVHPFLAELDAAVTEDDESTAVRFTTMFAEDLDA